MSGSDESAIELLTQIRERLRVLADQQHEQLVPVEEQQRGEHAVAVGVAELAGEQRPTASVDLPTRPIMAKDLLITVDLVLRALQSIKS